MGNPQTGPDDETIIRKCLEGNADAYSVLVDRYKNMAYNLAFRMSGDEDTAKDLSQESFIAAYTSLREFRFNAKFSSWLYSIVLNKCRDHLRRTKDTVSADELAEVLPNREKSPEQTASEGQDKDLLQLALDALPADYRRVLVLKHMEGMDYEEIAAITGMSVAALKVRAHRGRNMLKEAIEALENRGAYGVGHGRGTGEGDSGQNPRRRGWRG
jgi:RNA polymerase sigma-70 factor, ECF subfamily